MAGLITQCSSASLVYVGSQGLPPGLKKEETNTYICCYLDSNRGLKDHGHMENAESMLISGPHEQLEESRTGQCTSLQQRSKEVRGLAKNKWGKRPKAVCFHHSPSCSQSVSSG